MNDNDQYISHSMQVAIIPNIWGNIANDIFSKVEIPTANSRFPVFGSVFQNMITKSTIRKASDLARKFEFEASRQATYDMEVIDSDFQEFDRYSKRYAAIGKYEIQRQVQQVKEKIFL